MTGLACALVAATVWQWRKFLFNKQWTLPSLLALFLRLLLGFPRVPPGRASALGPLACFTTVAGSSPRVILLLLLTPGYRTE